MEYGDFMNSLVVRMDVFDDLTYLQKHLRLIIKIHQKLSSKLYISSSSTTSNGTKRAAVISKNFFTIRKLMDELEAEMEDISQEQKYLTDILKTSVSQYLEMLLKDCKIKVENDVANGFITRALQFHYQKNHLVIQPTNVKLRMPEEELVQKYAEIHRLTLAERPMQEQQKETTSKAATKQESLLKPKFRKPSTSSVAGSSGRVEKKMPARKTSIIETRHAKVIHQKQQKGVIVDSRRVNLLRALTKVKTEQSDGKSYPDEFDDNSSSTVMGNGKYNRSDEDCSDQSSYDGMTIDAVADPLKATGKRRSPASNASSEKSLDWQKKYPPLPLEPPPKTEYTQEEFLMVFHLITPQVADYLKLQGSKRKSRRNCIKNEKNDFHYGKFDLNEAAYRNRMSNNKRSILYSPNNKLKK